MSATISPAALTTGSLPFLDSCRMVLASGSEMPSGADVYKTPKDATNNQKNQKKKKKKNKEKKKEM